MKPIAYMTKSGVLFKHEPDAPLQLTPLYELQKPLSLEDIETIYSQTNPLNYYDFVRAIEKAHGIQ